MTKCTFTVYGHDFEVAGITLTHTFVYVSPDNLKSFACYGAIYPTDQSQKVSELGHGIYEIPNCYRDPYMIGDKVLFPDTANLGIYARHAVCHQTANCFMVQTKKTLDPSKVRGSGASYMAYGIYGNDIPFIKDIPFANPEHFHRNWLKKTYEPCAKNYSNLEENTPTESNIENKIFRALYSLYDKFAQENTHDPHDGIIHECSTVLKIVESTFDYKKIEDTHRDYLKEHTAIITSNKIKGIQLASEINELSIQFQKSLADIMNAYTYQKFFAVKPGEVCGIVEPDISALEKQTSSD